MSCKDQMQYRAMEAMRGLLVHKDFFFFVESRKFVSAPGIFSSAASVEFIWSTGPQPACIIRCCEKVNEAVEALFHLKAIRLQNNKLDLHRHLGHPSGCPFPVKLCNHRCHSCLPRFGLDFAVSYSWFEPDRYFAVLFQNVDSMHLQIWVHVDFRGENARMGSRCSHTPCIFCFLPATDCLEWEETKAFRTSNLQPAQLLWHHVCELSPESRNLSTSGYSKCTIFCERMDSWGYKIRPD